MKYKILISGRNNGLAVDFIQRAEMFFDALSTLECWQDMVGHFKKFDPQAFVCFVESDYKNVKQISALKTGVVYNAAENEDRHCQKRRRGY